MKVKINGVTINALTNTGSLESLANASITNQTGGRLHVVIVR